MASKSPKAGGYLMDRPPVRGMNAPAKRIPKARRETRVNFAAERVNDVVFVGRRIRGARREELGFHGDSHLDNPPPSHPDSHSDSDAYRS